MVAFDLDELRFCVKRVVTLHPQHVFNDPTAAMTALKNSGGDANLIPSEVGGTVAAAAGGGDSDGGTAAQTHCAQVCMFAEELVSTLLSALSIGLVPGLTLWNCATFLEKLAGGGGGGGAKKGGASAIAAEENLRKYGFATSVVYQVRTQLPNASAQQRSKAFIRCALNDNCLLSCLELMADIDDAVRTCYVDQISMLRCRGDPMWDEFITSIAPVSGPPLEARWAMSPEDIRALAFMSFELNLGLVADTAPPKASSTVAAALGTMNVDGVVSLGGELEIVQRSVKGANSRLTSSKLTKSSSPNSSHRHRKSHHGDGGEGGSGGAPSVDGTGTAFSGDHSKSEAGRSHRSHRHRSHRDDENGEGDGEGRRRRRHHKSGEKDDESRATGRSRRHRSVMDPGGGEKQPAVSASDLSRSPTASPSFHVAVTEPSGQQDSNSDDDNENDNENVADDGTLLAEARREANIRSQQQLEEEEHDRKQAEAEAEAAATPQKSRAEVLYDEVRRQGNPEPNHRDYVMPDLQMKPLPRPSREAVRISEEVAQRWPQCETEWNMATVAAEKEQLLLQDLKKSAAKKKKAGGRDFTEHPPPTSPLQSRASYTYAGSVKISADIDTLLDRYEALLRIQDSNENSSNNSSGPTRGNKKQINNSDECSSDVGGGGGKIAQSLRLRLQSAEQARMSLEDTQYALE